MSPYIIPGLPSHEVTIDRIIANTVLEFGITRDQLFRKTKIAQITWARQVIYYLIRKHLHIPFKDIAAMYSCDRSTVLRAVQQISTMARAKYDHDQVKKLINIENQLKHVSF